MTPHIELTWKLFCFKNGRAPVGKEFYFNVILICSFLTYSKIGHFSTYLLVIWISSFMKYLYVSHFLYGISIFSYVLFSRYKFFYYYKCE